MAWPVRSSFAAVFRSRRRQCNKYGGIAGRSFMKTWKVGIVGGGPGGLMTAYTVQKLAGCPVQLTLFEASDRLGGKILTLRFDAIPVRYEAGAEEIYENTKND